MLKKVLDVLIVFLLVFSPKIPLFYNGVILSGIFALFMLLVNKNGLYLLKSNIQSHFFIRIVFFLILIITVVLSITVLHMTYDISMVKTFVNQIITVFFVFVVCTYLSIDNNAEQMKKKLFYTFGLQVISILIAFISPSYHSFVLFVSDFSEQMLNYRGGIRTYSIAGSNFFGLGATFGLIYILYLDSVFRYRWFSLKYMFLFMLLVVGTFFIARTGFVGLGIAMFYVFLRECRTLRLFTFFFKMLVVIVALVFLFYNSLSIELKSVIENRVIPFALEMFLSENGYSTSSTNTLIDMWDMQLSLKTLLFGDGYYTNPSGIGYYRSTDVGYFRNILFGGIPFLFMMFLYQVFLLKKLFFNSYFRSLFWVILIYLSILHIKGETLGFLIIMITSLLFFILSSSKEHRIVK